MTTTVLNTKIKNNENEIPDKRDLVITTRLYTKIKEIEYKIPDISGLVMKTDYDAKTLDIEKKYFTTFGHNKFTKEITDANIKEIN